MNDKKGVKISLQKKDVINVLIGIIIVLVIILLYLLLFNNSAKNYEPNITINGEETVICNIGEKYEELGATATDLEDGDLTKKIKTISNVNTEKSGMYKVTYEVVDSANQVKRVTRDVIVTNNDTTNVRLEVTGDDLIFIPKEGDYIEGYKAYDKDGKEIVSDVIKYGKIDRSKPGTYTINYILKYGDEIVSKRKKIVVYDNLKEVNDEELTNKLINTLWYGDYKIRKVTIDTISDCDKLSKVFNGCVLTDYTYDKNVLTSDEVNKCLKSTLNVDKNIETNVICSNISYQNMDQGPVEAAWVKKIENKYNSTIKKVLKNNDYIYIYDEFSLTAQGLYEDNTWLETACQSGNINFVNKPGSININVYGDSEYKKIIGKQVCLDGKISKEIYTNTYYKHTYKKASDGNYYWISTEPL